MLCTAGGRLMLLQIHSYSLRVSMTLVIIIIINKHGLLHFKQH